MVPYLYDSTQRATSLGLTTATAAADAGPPPSSGVSTAAAARFTACSVSSSTWRFSTLPVTVTNVRKPVLLDDDDDDDDEDDDDDDDDDGGGDDDDEAGACAAAANGSGGGGAAAAVMEMHESASAQRAASVVASLRFVTRTGLPRGRGSRNEYEAGSRPSSSSSRSASSSSRTSAIVAAAAFSVAGKVTTVIFLRWSAERMVNSASSPSRTRWRLPPSPSPPSVAALPARFIWRSGNRRSRP